MVVGYQIPQKKNPYWLWAGISFVVAFLFMGIGGAAGSSITANDVSDCYYYGGPEYVGYPEYSSCAELEDDYYYGDDSGAAFVGFGCLSCIVSIILGILAISAGSAGSRTVIVQQQQSPMVVQQQRPMVVQQQRPMVVQQPVVMQQPAVQQRVSQPQPETKSDQRKSAHLQRAHQLEMDGDLAGAITAYELAEDFREAQRVRSALNRQGEQNQGGVNINIGKVGDTNTQVKDGVYMSGSDEDQV